MTTILRVAPKPLNPAERKAAMREYGTANMLAVRKRPYFATALLGATPVVKAGPGTLAVDKHCRIYFDPAVLKGAARWGGKAWTIPQLSGGLVHEIMHWLLRHFESAEPYYARHGNTRAIGKLINIVQDAEINPPLLADGLELPDGCVLPKNYGWPDGLTWEQYWDLIPQEVKERAADPSEPVNGGGGTPGDDGGQGGEDGDDQDGGGGQGGKPGQGKPKGGKGSIDDLIEDVFTPGKGPDCGSGADGQAREWEDAGPGEPGYEPGKGPFAVTQAEGDLMRDEIAAQIAEEAKKDRGNIPGSLLRWAQDRLKPPVIPWEKELAAQIRSCVAQVQGQVDFTYARHGRPRTFGGVIMPGMYRPVVQVAVVGDTSGSMSTDDLDRVRAEVEGIARAAGQRKVDFFSCDASVGSKQVVTGGAQIKLTGGGGTDMTVGIEAARKSGCQVLVVLTDGFTPWPERPPAGCTMIIGLIGAKHSRESARQGVPAWCSRVLDIPALEGEEDAA